MEKKQKEQMNPIVIAAIFVLLFVVGWSVSSFYFRLFLLLTMLVGCILLLTEYHYSLVEMIVPVCTTVGMGVMFLLLKTSKTREIREIPSGLRAPVHSPQDSPFDEQRREGRRAPPTSPSFPSLFTSSPPSRHLPFHRTRFSPNALDRLRGVSSPQRLEAMSQLRQLHSLPDWEDWKEWKKDVHQFVQTSPVSPFSPLSSSSSSSSLSSLSSSPTWEQKESERKLVDDLLQVEKAIEQNDPDAVEKVLELKEEIDQKERMTPAPKHTRRFYAKMMGLVSTALIFAALGAGLLGPSDERRWDGRGNVVM